MAAADAQAAPLGSDSALHPSSSVAPLGPPPPRPRAPQALTRRISFPSHGLPPAHLARLRRWLVCFALVDFDIDSGPILDNAFPTTRFPPATATNIAFSSLPEAPALPAPHLLPDHGYAYHWRIPCNDAALHGFVWFVRDRDDRLRRGYSQRSLVLITHLAALSGLFSALVAILGPLHFKHAHQGGMVETACYNIASWPDPTPGSTLELPFLGSVLTVALPLPAQAQFPLPVTHPPSPFLTPAAWHASRQSAHLPALTGPPRILAASLPPTPLCLLLFPPAAPRATTNKGDVGPVGYSKLLLLWELALLGEPLLVWAGEPRVAAEVVEALCALVRPIPFGGDLRPYFHVHDADFARLCKPGKPPPPGLLIASTNPLLLSTCKHWPHILRLDRAAAPSPALPPLSVPSVPPLVPTDAAAGAAVGSPASRPGAAGPDDAGAAGGNAGASAGAGKDFGLRSARKRHVKKDEAAEREIVDAWRRGDYLACDAAIYRHFATLTERFIAPLNRYFGTLWAGNEAVAARAPLLSPGPSPVPSTRFSRDGFLASLRTHGSPLPLRPAAPSLSQPGSTPTERLYTRFLAGPHFAAWLDARVRDTGGEVRRRYVRTLAAEDWEGWAQGRDVAEVDEMVGRLERELFLLEPQPPVPAHGSPPTEPSTSTSPLALSSQLSSAPAAPAGLGITTSPDPGPGTGPDTGSGSGTGTGTATLTLPRGVGTGDGPGARLRAGAERLRAVRDHRVGSTGTAP
ncbi:hypothetical protein JCM3770_005351 [Rhodotorula araucariae]